MLILRARKTSGRNNSKKENREYQISNIDGAKREDVREEKGQNSDKWGIRGRDERCA
jgi:hypothetical protein